MTMQDQYPTCTWEELNAFMDELRNHPSPETLKAAIGPVSHVIIKGDEVWINTTFGAKPDRKLDAGIAPHVIEYLRSGGSLMRHKNTRNGPTVVWQKGN